MYEVTITGHKFVNFSDAVSLAKIIRSDVVDQNGNRRWSPAPVVSAKKLRLYRERLAAYTAQQVTK